jgi:ribulose-phosphate 3-epimerase
MATIIPAPIPESFNDLYAQVERIHELVERVQIDISDGKFTPTRTWPFNKADIHFEKLLDEEEGLPFWQDIDFEIDMMVEKPEQYIDDWIRVGATALIIHHGSTSVFEAIAQEAHERGVEIGLAVRPSMEDTEWHPLVSHADFVQLMGNDKLGEHGVVLDEEKIYPQIERLKKIYPDVILGVDIGVTRDTAVDLVKAGVTRLAVWSALFRAQDIQEAVAYFKNIQ